MNSTQRAALQDLVRELAGVQCVWSNDKQPQLGATSGGKNAWVKLTPFGLRSKGTDEYRAIPNPRNANAFLSKNVGYRLFTVTMRAESADARVEGYELLEDVRAGFRSVTAQLVYRAQKLAFIRADNVTPLRASKDGHALRVATMDAVFAFLHVRDNKDDPGQTIGTVNGGDLSVPLVNLTNGGATTAPSCDECENDMYQPVITVSGASFARPIPQTNPPCPIHVTVGIDSSGYPAAAGGAPTMTALFNVGNVVGDKVAAFLVGSPSAWNPVAISDPHAYPIENPQNQGSFVSGDGYVLDGAAGPVTWTLTYSPNGFGGVGGPVTYWAVTG